MVESVGRIEAELGKTFLDRRAGEPVKKAVGGGEVGGVAEGNAALMNRGVVVGKLDERTGLPEVRAGGDGEGDEGGLGIAGVGELGGLHDVLANDEFGGECLLEVKGAEFGDGGLTVGSVLAVRNRDVGDPGGGKDGQGQGLRWGVLASPEDEDSGGVRHGLEVVGEVSVDELLGVGAVSGKEEVFRCAVLQLLSKGRGGAEGGQNVDAGLALVLGSKGGEDGLQISGHGDVEFVPCLCAEVIARKWKCKGEEKAA